MQDYNRIYDASPSFQWINSAQLTVGSTISSAWESYNSTTQKYLPFNMTRIVNNGEDDIYFYPNENSGQKIFIPKGTIITMDFNFLPALRTFTIAHAGSTSTISANKIIVTCSRQGQNSDSIVARLHKRLFETGQKGVI